MGGTCRQPSRFTLLGVFRDSGSLKVDNNKRVEKQNLFDFGVFTTFLPCHLWVDRYHNQTSPTVFFCGVELTEFYVFT